MKGATEEGSMTIITIVIIVALGAAAAVIVGFLITKAGSEANNAAGTGTKVTEQSTIGNNLFDNNGGNNGGNNG